MAATQTGPDRRAAAPWRRFALLCSLFPLPALAEPASRGADVEALLSQVVNIAVTAYTVTSAPAANMVGQSSMAPARTKASGFIIDAAGLIVTNRHAVANAAEIMVVLHDSTRLRATVLATAAQSDIAVLKVNADRPLSPARFGDSERLRPGDPVLLIGNPLGLGSTITSGIVSALERNTKDSGAGAFFQIDAALNHGSSGGPVYNADGEVVGIATALISAPGDDGSVGLGLAIPSNDASAVVRALLGDGRVRTGWIGARVERLTEDLAAALGLPATDGSIVLDVADGSPAARSGLIAGDVILKVGGSVTETPRALNRRIAQTAIGETVDLLLWRAGSFYTLPVVISEVPEPAASEKAAVGGNRPAPRVAGDDFGLVIGPMTRDLQRKFGRSSTGHGVAVIDVVAHSLADDHGIVAGTIILNIDRKPVGSVVEAKRSIDAARSEKRPYVILLIEDEQGLHWVSLPTAASFAPD